MINSLSKDSHITRSSRFSRNLNLERNKRQRHNQNTPANNNIGISVNKPAKISFGGFIGAKLANTDEFSKFMARIKKFLPDNIKFKKLKEFTKEVIEAVKTPEKPRNEQVQKFLKDGQDDIQDIIDKTQKWVKEDNKDKVFNDDDFKKDFKDVINAAIDGNKGLEEAKNKKWYKSETIQKILKLADDNRPVFNAMYAIALTCFLRPATIMALPGEKKNKDDKKYAAAHSIASGLIGFCVATVLGSVPRAVKKITKNPENFIKNKSSYLLKSKKSLFTATTMSQMLTETLYSPPKAMLTIALIPIILEKVFGLSKGKSKQNEKNIPISENYAALNHQNSAPQKRIAFNAVIGGDK